MVAGIETRTYAVCRDGTLKGTTMATAKSDTTPYWRGLVAPPTRDTPART
jgi:hypothetical protein